MKRPTKPSTPVEPKEFLPKTRDRFDIYSGTTLKEIMDYTGDLEAEFNCESDYYDSYNCFFEYDSKEQRKNFNYAKQMAKYRIDLETYEDRVKKYKEDLKIYNDWKVSEQKKKEEAEYLKLKNKLGK